MWLHLGVFSLTNGLKEHLLGSTTVNSFEGLSRFSIFSVSCNKARVFLHGRVRVLCIHSCPGSSWLGVRLGGRRVCLRISGSGLCPLISYHPTSCLDHAPSHAGRFLHLGVRVSYLSYLYSEFQVLDEVFASRAQCRFCDACGV